MVLLVTVRSLPIMIFVMNGTHTFLIWGERCDLLVNICSSHNISFT